jgi:hypothetical protein
MMLSVLAVGMLATVMLTVNTNVQDNNNAVQMSQYRIMASSLATSEIQRATGLAFDQNTVSAPVTDVTGLSTVLGVETGEVDTAEDAFNDFDDYNNFHKWVKADTIFFRSADFYIHAAVDYVTITGNAIVHSSTRTYTKRIIVYVSSPYMATDTITATTLYSYWYFR